MGDRHLEAAEVRVVHHFAGLIEGHSLVATRDIVTAYLDSLLGELPEEAVEAAADTGVVGVTPGCTCPEASYGPRPASCRCDERAERFVNEKVAKALTASLRSLRDSLASGQGQQHEG